MPWYLQLAGAGSPALYLRDHKKPGLYSTPCEIDAERFATLGAAEERAAIVKQLTGLACTIVPTRDQTRDVCVTWGCQETITPGEMHCPAHKRFPRDFRPLPDEDADNVTRVERERVAVEMSQAVRLPTGGDA